MKLTQFNTQLTEITDPSNDGMAIILVTIYAYDGPDDFSFPKFPIPNVGPEAWNSPKLDVPAGGINTMITIMSQPFPVKDDFRRLQRTMSVLQNVSERMTVYVSDLHLNAERELAK